MADFLRLRYYSARCVLASGARKGGLVMRHRVVLLFTFVLGGVLNTTVPAADLWWPGPDYPLPERAAAPAWLLTQKLNFSRWDGGPLEVCKGMLSGWPY